MNKQRGISQIVVMVIMLVLAIALPITTKLVQQNQENRSKAAAATYTCAAQACSANYGCMRNGTYVSSTADCSAPVGTVNRTYDASCPRRNGAGGGNDNACPATTTTTAATYTCAAQACSANYGCMRNGTYISSTEDCSVPIGTVSRTYDASCPKRNGAGGGNDNACPATTTTYTCSAQACSANYGCMRNGTYISSTEDCSVPIGTVSRTYDASCPKRNGAGGGNDNACPATTTTYTCSAQACSANYGCMRNGTYISSTEDCSVPIGTVSRTYDASCPKRNGAGGGNDNACKNTTYTCAAKACSANYGCMRNGDYTSSTEDCSVPIGTVSRTYDASCPKRNGAGGGNDDACKTTTADTPIVIKMAFAGVKKGNAKCASNWSTFMKITDASGKNPLTGGGTVASVPVSTDSVNSKGNIIYTYTTNLVGFGKDTITNGLSFFLVGPKHISIKYGKNGQSSWFSDFVGSLSVTGGATNTYDFSEYPLLAGDVTGNTNGTPDGKIDGRDFSYIKEKANVFANGADGTSVSGDLDGNCQVNSGDISLIKQSLTEINGQTY